MNAAVCMVIPAGKMSQSIVLRISAAFLVISVAASAIPAHPASNQEWSSLKMGKAFELYKCPARAVRLNPEEDPQVVRGGAGATVAKKPIEHMRRVVEQIGSQVDKLRSNFRRV
jgi:hypothetical protein